MSPADVWRRWRQLPVPAEEPFPSRIEAVEMAFAMHAATHERAVVDVAESFAKKED